MGFLSTVGDILQASTQSANRGDGAETDSRGAYWCHDCAGCIRDVEVEGEGDDPPDCPQCGDEMEVERSAGSTGCAC